MTGSLIANYPIEKIEVLHLKHYLFDRGWQQEPFGRKEALKFKSPRPIIENKYLEILIPSQRDLADYSQAVISALRAISLYEKRSVDEIIPQVLVFGDLLKFHIATESTKDGNIPIGEGLTLYDDIRDILIFSASAELFPGKRIFPRRLKAAVDFAESSLIAPSNYGSYIANILCPLPRKESHGVVIDEYPPLPRRAVVRILRGLKDVSEAVYKESTDPIINNYQKGLNANMCEALAGIIESAKGNDLNISTNLAPPWPKPEDIPTEVTLNSSSKEYLEAAAEIFDEQIAKGKCSLIGMALNLTRNPKEEEKERVIRLVTQIEGRGTTSVIIPLDEASYRNAVDAHKDLKLIRVNGDLEKIGRRWYLNNPEKLEVINDIDTNKINLDKTRKKIMNRTIKRIKEPNLESKLGSF